MHANYFPLSHGLGKIAPATVVETRALSRLPESESQENVPAVRVAAEANGAKLPPQEPAPASGFLSQKAREMHQQLRHLHRWLERNHSSYPLHEPTRSPPYK